MAAGRTLRSTTTQAKQAAESQDNGIQPVNRATLPQAIVKSITELIANRVWRPGEQESRRVHPAGGGRAPEDAPGLAAPLVYVVEEWVSAQSLQTLLHR